MIREAFKDSIDAGGWVKDGPWGPSQNRILDLSEYMILLYKAKELTDSDREQYLKLIRSCEVKPGLYMRSQGSLQACKWDDYVGVITASYCLKLPLHQEIRDWGVTHAWCWNAERPEKWEVRFWFGRSLSFVAHLNYACQVHVPLPAQLGWGFTLISSGRSNRDDQDARTGSWLILQTEPEWRTDPFNQKVKEKWWKRFKRDYPGGMKEVQRNYRMDKEHPFGEVWID